MPYKEKARSLNESESTQQQNGEKELFKEFITTIERLVREISAFIGDTFGKELDKKFIMPGIKYESRYFLNAAAGYEKRYNRIVLFKGYLDIYMKSKENDEPQANTYLVHTIAHEMSHAIVIQFYKDKATISYPLDWYDKINEGIAELTGMYITQAILAGSKVDLLQSTLLMLNTISNDAKRVEQNFSNDISKLKSLENASNNGAILKGIILNVLDKMEFLSTYYRPALGFIQVVVESKSKSLPKIMEDVLEDPSKFDSLKDALTYKPIDIEKLSENASSYVKALIGLYKLQRDAEQKSELYNTERFVGFLTRLKRDEESLLQKMSQEEKKELVIKCVEILEYAKNEWSKIDGLAEGMSKRIEELSLLDCKRT